MIRGGVIFFNISPRINCASGYRQHLFKQAQMIFEKFVYQQHWQFDEKVEIENMVMNLCQQNIVHACG